MMPVLFAVIILVRHLPHPYHAAGMLIMMMTCSLMMIALVLYGIEADKERAGEQP